MTDSWRLISGRPAAIQIHAWMLPSLHLLAPPTQPLNICPWGAAYPVDVTSTSSQMESPSQQAAGHFCRFSQGTEDKLFHPRPHLSCKPTLCCPHPQRVSTQTCHLLLGKSWFFLLFHLPWASNSQTTNSYFWYAIQETEISCISLAWQCDRCLYYKRILSTFSRAIRRYSCHGFAQDQISKLIKISKRTIYLMEKKPKTYENAICIRNRKMYTNL